jgi:hypothetical protein
LSTASSRAWTLASIRRSWFSSHKSWCVNWFSRPRQCHIATNGQSVSKFWCRTPSGAHDQIFITLWQLGSCFCGAPSLSFTYADGPRQRSLSRVRVPWHSWPYFTVSVLILPFSSPPTTRRVTVEVFDPASTRVTASTPSGKLVFYYLWPTAYRTPNSRVQFLVSVVTSCLRRRCLGNVLEPLPSKIGPCLAPLFWLLGCLTSRCLAMDACSDNTIAAFRRHVTILVMITKAIHFPYLEFTIYINTILAYYIF